MVDSRRLVVKRSFVRNPPNDRWAFADLRFALTMASMRSSRRAEATATREDVILARALDLFFEQGFEGCSLRNLAGALEINPATLYHYFASKDQILFRLQHDGMVTLMERAQAALGEARDGSPRERLLAVLRAHFTYHTEHYKSARLHVAEYRSLATGSRRVIRDQMKDYELIFTRLVEEGVKDGEFAPWATKITAFTMMGAGAHISNWYKPDGSLPAAEIVEEAIRAVMQGLLIRP